MAESGVVDLPPKKWTGLSCFQLHLDRADIADGGVATRSIVEAFDVGKDIPCGFCPCCIVPVVDELGLERVKEALHRSIVIAVSLAAHRRSEAGGLHQLAVICRGILNAAIGMVDQAKLLGHSSMVPVSTNIRFGPPGAHLRS